MSAIALDRHDERGDNLVGSFKNSSSAYHRRSKLYDVNIENLKTVIEYLTHLRNIEKLSDKEFSALITHVCAKFVENEMVLVINKVLGKAFKDLKKILREFKDEW
jgi:hypothetical protein